MRRCKHKIDAVDGRLDANLTPVARLGLGFAVRCRGTRGSMCRVKLD